MDNKSDLYQEKDKKAATNLMHLQQQVHEIEQAKFLILAAKTSFQTIFYRVDYMSVFAKKKRFFFAKTLI